MTNPPEKREHIIEDVRPPKQEELHQLRQLHNWHGKMKSKIDNIKRHQISNIKDKHVSSQFSIPLRHINKNGGMAENETEKQTDTNFSLPTQKKRKPKSILSGKLFSSL